MLAFVVGFMMGMTGSDDTAASAVGGIIGLVGTVMIAFAAVKRLHDLGRPGSHYWFFLVPLYNLYLGFMLLFQRGSDGNNQFGGDPVIS